MKRNLIQAEATEAIVKNNYNGVVDISPRVGKSKILIDSIKDKFDWNIVILSPYKPIQDSWNNEFVKWKVPSEINIVNLCTKSVNKIQENLDLLIIDEIQTLSVNQIDWIKKKKPKRILGLTGTYNKETEILISRTLLLKTIFKYSIDSAINDNIISNFEIILVECELNSTIKNVESGSKHYRKLVSEKEHYNYLTTNFDKFNKLSITNAHFESLRNYFVRERTNLIYNSPTKLNVAKKIVENIKRCLVFSSRVEHAGFLAGDTYHNKNKKENNLEKFIERSIDKLGVCETINMGVTIPVLKRAVIHQLKSSSEMSLQKILRTCNLEDDEVAKIYVTYYKDTVDYNWVNRALESVNSGRIRRITTAELENELLTP